jgi:hypothetical protein
MMSSILEDSQQSYDGVFGWIERDEEPFAWLAVESYLRSLRELAAALRIFTLYRNSSIKSVFAQ